MAEFEKIERALFRRPILLHAEDPNDKVYYLFIKFIDVIRNFRSREESLFAGFFLFSQYPFSYF